MKKNKIKYFSSSTFIFSKYGTKNIQELQIDVALKVQTP